MSRPKIKVDGLSVVIKLYPEEVELEFSSQYELENFLLQLVFAQVEN